ncbi:MAG: hypothetical protein ACREDU_12015 [Methylocella sp.]
MVRFPAVLANLAIAALVTVATHLPAAADDTLQGVAQIPKSMSVADLSALKGNMALASGLVAMGKAQKDPHALLVAAKLLASVGAGVEIPRSSQASGKPQFYDVGEIVAEAKTYAAGNEALIAELSAIDLTKPQNYCNWIWECNDVLCDRYYICTTD